MNFTKKWLPTTWGLLPLSMLVCIGLFLAAIFSASAEEVITEDSPEVLPPEIVTEETIIETDNESGNTLEGVFVFSVSETESMVTPTEEVPVEESTGASTTSEMTEEESFVFAAVANEPEATTSSEDQVVEEPAFIFATSESTDTLTTPEEVVETTTSTTVEADTQQPTLTTDKDDYHPGDIAIIFGRFFAPLQTFILKIFGSDENNENYTETVEEVDTDNEGSFSFAYTLDSLYRPFYEVTVATLGGETVAETWFRDAAVQTYDQCSNDDGDGYASGDTGCRWINGNLNGNNSTYQEGDATVQRLALNGFAPGTSHTVTIQYGTTKQGKHAYDFLTTWDHSENWIAIADRCQGIPGCTTAAETTLPIPDDPNDESGHFQGTVGPRNFVMRGGTLDSAGVPTMSGDYLGDSETTIQISFTVANSGDMCTTKNNITSCGIALWFGAHISKSDDWFPYNGTEGATSIQGSPYHVALSKLDGGSIGNRDNQMQASAIQAPTTGTIIIVKNTVGGDGSFDYTGDLGGFSIVTSGNTGSSTFLDVDAGSYDVTESAEAGWDFTNLTCDDPDTGSSVNGTTATIDLDAEETVTCTYTNTERGSITVEKQVVGTDKSFSFSGAITDSLSDNESTSTSVAAGQYVVTEGADADYDLTSVICDDGNSVGSTTARNATFIVAAGEDVTCVFTNSELPTLTLVKTVVNDDGGTASSTDFDVFLDGATTTWYVPIQLAPGDYTASESVASGYEAGDWGDDCDADGDVTLQYGDDLTCTITNDDIAPSLKLIKNVTTNNGGNEDASDWTLTASGTGGFSDSGDSTTFHDVQAGVAYTLFESVVSGYSAGNWSCDGGSTTTDSVTLALADQVTCQITNDDIAPTITLTKVVQNNFGGTAGANDFGISIGGNYASSGVSYDVDANVAIALDEDGLSGYEFVSLTGDAGCPASLGGTVTLDEGENIACTITNKDLPGSISGSKFEDVDGDGVWDGGELGIPNWTIYLFDGSATTSTTTDSNGGYSFTGLSAGTYTVTEQQQNGWTQTTVDPSAINLSNNEDVEDIDFGNFKHGSVSGYKFEDVDGDGLARETGEPFLAGWTLRLYDTNESPWELIATDVTSASGTYSFTNIPMGSYKVCEVLIDDWVQTFPNISDNNSSASSSDEGPKCQTVNIDTSDESNTRNFGNYHVGSISGFKFHDRDMDEAWSTSTEEALAGWTINLEGTDGMGNNVSRSTTTDANGYYFFDNLAPGSYDVTETVQLHWFQTTDDPATIDLESGDDEEDVNFGNVHLGSITIVKDAVPNDSQDFSFMGDLGDFILDDDAGVQGILDADEYENATTAVDIFPGSYDVTELLPNDDWELTGISCSTSSVTVDLGTETVTIDLAPGADVTCTFTNQTESPTRTQGFWQTHYDYTSDIFNNELGGELVIGDPDAKTIVTTGELFGAFWANIAKKTTGKGKSGRRSDLDKARMQLLQQLVAAELNCAAFGCSGSVQSMIADAHEAYSGTDIGDILDAAGEMDAFNNSGDTIILNGNPGSADPKAAKADADLLFWDDPASEL